jgi:hypothetical protein
MVGVFHEDGSGNNGPENVADSRGSAGRTPTDPEEFSEVYAASATLACRLDSSGCSDGLGNGAMARQYRLGRGVVQAMMTRCVVWSHLDVVFFLAGRAGLLDLKLIGPQGKICCSGRVCFEIG